MQNGVLDLDEATPWARRVPTTALVLGSPLTVLLATVLSADTSLYPHTLAEATAWSYVADALLSGVIIAAALTSWFAPRLSAWLVAAAASPVLVNRGETAGFHAVGWCWSGLVLLDLVLRLRQHSRSTWEEPETTTGTRWRADRHGAVRVLVGLVLALVIGVSGARYLSWRTDATQLAQRAVPAVGTVVEADTDIDEISVKVRGERVTIGVDDGAEFPPGSTVDMMVDPSGRRTPYSPLNADPEGRVDGALASGGALYLVVLLVIVGSRRRRLERTASRIGPGTLLRVRHAGWGLNVYAHDDVSGRRPLAYLSGIEHLWQAEATDLPRVKKAWEEFSETVQVLRDVLWRPSGADVRRGDDDDDTAEAEHAATFAQEDEPPSQVWVHGFTADGAFCVLRMPGMDLAVGGARPLRDAWTVSAMTAAVRRRGAGATSGQVPPELVAAQERMRVRLADGADRVMRDLIVPILERSSVLVVLTIAAAGLTAPALIDGADPFANLVIGVLASQVAGWVWTLRRRPLTVSRWGMRVAGVMFDALVLPEEIASLDGDADRVVVTMYDDLGELVYELAEGTEDDGSSVADLTSVRYVVATVLARRDAGLFAPKPRWLPVWLPSSTSVVVAAVLLCWMLPGLW